MVFTNLLWIYMIFLQLVGPSQFYWQHKWLEYVGLVAAFHHTNSSDYRKWSSLLHQIPWYNHVHHSSNLDANYWKIPDQLYPKYLYNINNISKIKIGQKVKWKLTYGNILSIKIFIMPIHGKCMCRWCTLLAIIWN